jgi:alkylhydroperoxidase family enzyme
VSDDQLRTLADYETSDAFTQAERAALRLADALTGTPATVPDALFAELNRWYSEAELVELSTAIAWENFRARFNRVYEVEAEGFSDGAYCPMPLRDGGGGA